MPDNEGLREELTAALADHITEDGRSVVAVLTDVLGVLAPTVERYTKRRVAEALREAAWALRNHHGAASRHLTARADALAAEGTAEDGTDVNGCEQPDLRGTFLDPDTPAERFRTTAPGEDSRPAHRQDVL